MPHARVAQQRPKVFKGGTAILEPGGTTVFRRDLAVRQITTRRDYPGIQRISLRINGQDFGDVGFCLNIPESSEADI